MDKNFLHYKLIPNNYLDSYGKIKEEFKYKINIQELKIKDSKFIPNPGDKFETMLFLPPNKNRIGEGGLRTKGFFKFSYKLVGNSWFICDLDGNPITEAPEKLQNEIKHYISNQISLTTFLPLITVITVVLNGVNTLEKTIKSIIIQNYPNIEYIVIDGGSTDGTLDIIKKYCSYIDYWVSEPDRGIYEAMNKGIKLATGNWINFMNSGDLFVNNNVVSDVFKDTNINCCDIIYGNTLLILDKQCFKIIPKSLNKIYKRSHIFHQSTFLKRELFLEELYDENLKISADYKWLMSMYFSHKKNFCYKNVDVSLYDGDNGISSRKLFQALMEDCMIRVKVLGIKSLYICMMAFIITSIKYLLKLIIPINYRKKILKFMFGAPVKSII